MMAALNSCGYDQELSESGALRAAVRSEVQRNIAASAAAQEVHEDFCRFFKDHQKGDASHNLAQYISLALMLSPPPEFKPVVRESDLPPDASYVLGAAPLLQRLYSAAKLQDVWQNHRAEYQQLVERFHAPVANMIFSTDIYLRLQMSGYLGRNFIVYLEPLIAPSAINARNYGDNYYLVLAPLNHELPMHAVRHTYLHYVLDAYALNHGTLLKRMDPIMAVVQTAPMDESFKQDTSLLVTECLIRAIEARTLPGKDKQAEQLRQAQVQRSMREGFVLTKYFYDALVKYENGPAGLKDSYDSWLYDLDVNAERKNAQNIEFASAAEPELLQSTPAAQEPILDSAERRLMAHDAMGATKLAQQALQDKQGDTGRAFFILARSAAESGDMPGAETYFERAAGAAHDPRLIAWSHIYLGRILDIKQQRDAAIAQYRAALAAGDTAPDTLRAANRGLAQPYASPRAAAAQPQ